MLFKSSFFSPFSLTAFACLIVGGGGFLLGLSNATTLALSEQGYYVTLLAFGLFSAVSVQKNMRDKQSGLPVSTAYAFLSCLAAMLALALLAVGLLNATLALSEKGYYAMSFLLALFSAICLQKELRSAEPSINPTL